MNDIEELVEGQEFWGILGERIKNPETNRIRVRTLPDQDIPPGIFVECSKSIREAHELDTIFKMNVKVSGKKVGRLYVHSLKKQELLTVDEWNAMYG
jgi:hypothetical protein